jgi:uncharacterized protein YndB with AHSA1/START domain
MTDTTVVQGETRMTDELGEITSCYTITFRRSSKHSAARLWRALTSADEVAAWMEAPAKIDLRVGGTFTVFAEGKHVEECVIVQLEPERVLAYVWGMNRPEAWGNRMSVVRWVIEEGEGGCTYTFVHNGCADRGDGEEGLAAGWHGFLDQLDAHLDGETWTKDEAEARWHALHVPYKERLERAIVR